MSLSILHRRPKEINKVVLIALADLDRNPHQPRAHFDHEAIQELAGSIEANGLLQPIVVRKKDSNRYELVAGERRTLAFRFLGRDMIPAIVESYSDEESAVYALIENIQRKDLNCFEQAKAIVQLMEHLGLNQQQISKRLGKAQSTVANKLRLLRFTSEMQNKMIQSGLSERHARALLKLEQNSLREKVLDLVIEQNMTVEKTEQYIESLLEKKDKKQPARLFVVKDMRMFQNSIKRAVQMMALAGIPIDSKKTESEEYVEYSIRIPKQSVYRTMNAR